MNFTKRGQTSTFRRNNQLTHQQTEKKMNSKLLLPTLSPMLLAPLLGAILTTSTALAADTTQSVCYPVGTISAAGSTLSSAASGMPQFFVTVKWGQELPGKTPFESQQAAYVTLEGQNVHQAGPVVFQNQGIMTRCENGHSSTAKLGNLGVLSFTHLIYKIGCGGHEEGATFTVKPGTPQQLTYKLKCNLK
jgi:hypothetical protein